ncbi:acylphosphatase [Salinicoccus halitifaciens]|uniref:Acylphosphatase n=1 Tax=Salinicoccus halitifaciens TaxID=1073415 RepID=A0ABV2EC04_9STAP|nr:acylphosphatase [Salinicoccus halitifaciens]MCD2137388.1 acylphosphatase [Salinicoccus halitifaciens]
MQDKSAEWFPHLSGQILEENYGSHFDAFLIALEGWRRGLTLRWHVKESEKFPGMLTWEDNEPGQLFSLKSDEDCHYFFRSRGDKVTKEAVKTTRDTEKLQKKLLSAGITLPAERQSTKDEYNSKSEELVEKYSIYMVGDDIVGAIKYEPSGTAVNVEEPLDVLDVLPEAFKETALKASETIPGFGHGIINIITQGNTPEPYVNGVDLTGRISEFLYPVQGKARDIPAAIIDYYFPGTCKNVHNAHNAPVIFFDYNEVIQPLRDRTADNVKIVSYECGSLISRKFILSGEVDKYSFHRWIKGEAKEYNLDGYTRYRSDGKLEIVAATPDEEKINAFYGKILERQSDHNITIIGMKEFLESIKKGFSNIGERRELLNLYHEAQEDLKSAEEEIEVLEDKHLDMLNSNSWKATAPLRKFTGVGKGLYRHLRKK